MSSNPRIFPGHTLNGVDSSGPPREYVFEIKFPAGSNVVEFDWTLGSSRIAPVRCIEILGYSFTFDAMAPGVEFPASVKFGTFNSSFISSNTYYGSIADGNSVPILLLNPILTPNGNTRFAHQYDTPYRISEFPAKTNKSLPASAQFYVSSLVPSVSSSLYPGSSLPKNTMTFAGESTVIMRVETWGEEVEYVNQQKKNMSISYYYG